MSGTAMSESSGCDYNIGVILQAMSRLNDGTETRNEPSFSDILSLRIVRASNVRHHSTLYIPVSLNHTMEL